MTPKTAYRNKYPIGSIWKCTKHGTKYVFVIKHGNGTAYDQIIVRDMNDLLGKDHNYFMQFDAEHFTRVA